MQFKLAIKLLGTLFIFVNSNAIGAEKTVGELLRRVEMSKENNTMSTKQSITLPQQTYYNNSKRQHVDFGSIQPPRSSEIMSSEGVDNNRVALEKVTDQQIKELFKLTQKLKNSPNRGELWLRLAELYVEKADYISSRKQIEYEAKLKLFNEKKISRKPIIDLSESREYNKKSIQLYEYYVRDFKNEKKMDQALYFLGFNYFEIGEVKKGTAYYTRLFTEYPNSHYVNEAYFSVGEYYFDTNQWSVAYENYSRVIKSKDSRLFAFAIYKGAWCLYKQGRTKEGMKYLEMIVRLSDKQANFAKLDDEAKRDLVVFYVDVGDPSNAYDYFKDMFGESKVFAELEKLAYFYTDKGYKEKSHIIFKKLIELNPTHPKTYDYQYQIVSSYVNLLNNQTFRKELYDLIKNYGKESDWHKANSAKSELVQNSLKMSESFLRAYILHHHQAAQNSKGKVSQEMTLEGYKLYLAEFKDSSYYPDMMFFYGELLYDMQHYGEAAEQYQWVAKNAPNGKYGAKSSMNMILGLEKDLPTEEEMQKRVNKSTERIDFDPKVKKFVENGEWYLVTYPKGEKNVELRFRMARLYYLSNHFDEAEKHFKIIVKDYPKSKQAEYSSNLLLDIYSLKKDYVGLEKTATDLLSNEKFADTESATEVKSVLEKAAFKAAQDLEEKKDFVGSAIKYQEFGIKYPRSNLYPASQFNAGVNYDRANLPLKAIASFENVQKSTTKESQALKFKVNKILPKMFQDMGLYQNAAYSYIIAADQEGRSPQAANYYYNGALLFDALNDVERAIRNYQNFLKLAKEHEKPDIYYKLSQLNKRNKRYQQAIEMSKNYIATGKDPYMLIESHYDNAIHYMALKDEEKARYWKFQTIKKQKELVPLLKGPGAEFADRKSVV